MASQQPASSQPQRALGSLSEEDLQRRANELVQYLLVVNQSNQPVTRADMMKNVIKDMGRATNSIIEKAKGKLVKCFGLKLVEMEGKKFILVNDVELDAQSNYLPWLEDEDKHQGFLAVVLCTIFMMGKSASLDAIFEVLERLGLPRDRATGDSIFGDVKKLLTVDLPREGYVTVKRIPNSDPPETVLELGERTYKETSDEEMLELVAMTFKNSPSDWTEQCQWIIDANKDNKNGGNVEVKDEDVLFIDA